MLRKFVTCAAIEQLGFPGKAGGERQKAKVKRRKVFLPPSDFRSLALQMTCKFFRFHPFSRCAQNPFLRYNFTKHT